MLVTMSELTTKRR